MIDLCPATCNLLILFSRDALPLKDIVFVGVPVPFISRIYCLLSDGTLNVDIASLYSLSLGGWIPTLLVGFGSMSSN